MESGGYNGSSSGGNPSHDTVPAPFGDGFTLEKSFVDNAVANPPLLLSDPARPVETLAASVTEREGLWKDRDFSDSVLDYINQILMEEDIEDTNGTFQEDSVALQAAEKSFSEVLGVRCCLSPKQQLGGSLDQNLDIPNKNHAGEYTECEDSGRYHNLRENGCSLEVSRGKKNPHSEDVDVECVRGTKQPAVYTELGEQSVMFDMMLLSSGEVRESALREAFQNETRMTTLQNRRKKRKDKVDLRALLRHCAEAIAADDRRKADELLKQIRQHSSPTGDGIQRLATCFADGLDARLAGRGTPSQTNLIRRPEKAADCLKATHFFLVVCPFLKLSNFFSNKTIMRTAEKATKLHIVDFGIHYGFQWPSFIEQLASRPGGPPKLRITGIDFPTPGFKPTERIAQTGHRLAEYAKRFNVPFEFHPIVQKWETIQMEDIRIESEEVLAVNCLFRFRYLLDESVVSSSPRDTVLNLIKKMKPDVFVQGVVNAGYSAPFFLMRFREAMFHYSAMFNVFETMAPRLIPERLLVEREQLRWEIMNVIACEGLERIERAETYKQWQVRNTKAGFRQLPLNKEIVDTGRELVKSLYHKDFVVDSNGEWLLQGWKGRILSALSCWKPLH